MERTLKAWLVVGMLLGTMAYAIAEDITLTTYYPSPRGVYNELRSNNNTFLAVQGGSVGIGAASASAKLDVTGTTILRGTVTIQDGTQATDRVLMSDANGQARWDYYVPKYE